jgi:trimeric autotransporter adhesin
MPLTTVGTSMISSGGGNVATNTALGSGALQSNTTASNNTAVGYQSLYANTTGVGLVAVGSEALKSNTTGVRNVALGGLQAGVQGAALAANTTGGNNIGIGVGALTSNTTANDNLGIGTNALALNTTGNNNQAFGSSAGSSLTTGSGNLLLGMRAGSNLTTGTANTFVGPNWNTDGAGAAMTTGVGNTIVGAFTGNQGGLDIRTATNRIVLSDGSGNPRGIFDGDGSFYIGLTPPPGYGGNAAYVITYLGSTRPAMRLYDTLTGSTPSTVINFVRNGNSVGQIFTTDTATSYVTSSDYRLKENVQPMTGALAKVSQLKPCTYTWKSSGSAGQGFIAHELQEVVPEGVYGEKDGVDKDGNPEYQGIDTSFLVATLTAAIQEQQAIITDLKARIEILEAN